MQHSIPDWSRLEAILHHDPGGRGVASYRHAGQPLDAGQLRLAAESLAHSGERVAIVTGFCILAAEPPAAETDGPPGALMLAEIFSRLGIMVELLSDRYGIPLLKVGCRELDLSSQVRLREIPFESDDLASQLRTSNETSDSPRTQAWIDALLAESAHSWTHLIAIERAGPSHHALSACSRDFEALVPLHERNVCHNMRGGDITAHTAKAHLLFETIAQRRLPITTIGIGDGGNEIGLGSYSWNTLRQAIQVGPGRFTACRIPTTHTILAGVSNWGGYALAAVVARLRQRPELATAWTRDRLARLIHRLVNEAGAVDGVSAARTATVDGIALDSYLDQWSRIRDAAAAS